MYNPINEHKLSKDAKKELEKAMKILKTQAKHVSIPWKIYDEFLEAMSIHCRKLYKDEIPVGNKVMVRR